MPQKVNPKLSMGIMANSQKLYALSSMVLSAAHRPFEGDAYANIIYDSGVAEAIEVSIGLFVRAHALITGLRPDTARMTQNLYSNDGLIFSEGIMMKLAPQLGKQHAHDLVYEAAMRSRQEDKTFFELLSNPDTNSILFEDDQDSLKLKHDQQFGLSSAIAQEFAHAAKILREQHLAGDLTCQPAAPHVQKS